jgi:SpoVK/Ycf46/Vps4 family AAA+-type ATPase
MSAVSELERYAVQYSSEAIKLDRQGSRGLAISKYQRATEVLLKLCSLYPTSPQNRIYMKRVEAYRERIKQLQAGSESEREKSAPAGKSEPFPTQQRPNIKWADIAGLEDAKRAIQESLIYPVKRPDLFPLGWPKGILLFGPPGCGKTLIAAAVANEIDAAFYCIDAATIMSKWLGESEKNVSKLFQDARSQSKEGHPSIIFIDEIDSLVGARTEEVGGETRTRNQFLKEMDSVMDKNVNNYVYVIGATNKPWSLDGPFIRRFQKRILIPLPSPEGRIEMFKIYCKDLKINPDVKFNKLVTLTEGYTGSDIRDIFQAVQIRIVREFFESSNGGDETTQPREINMNDFNEVLGRRKSSVTPEMLKYYDKWFHDYKAL